MLKRIWFWIWLNFIITIWYEKQAINLFLQKEFYKNNKAMPKFWKGVGLFYDFIENHNIKQQNLKEDICLFIDEHSYFFCHYDEEDRVVEELGTYLFYVKLDEDINTAELAHRIIRLYISVYIKIAYQINSQEEIDKHKLWKKLNLINFFENMEKNSEKVFNNNPKMKRLEDG